MVFVIVFFLSVMHLFSEGIGLSEAVQFSFLSLDGATNSDKWQSKIVKSPKIGGKVCAHHFI